MKVLVIGSGPGGYPAALKLKALGAQVTVAETKDFGGTCLNRGCIPSKALLEIGHRKHNLEELSSLADKEPLNLKNYFSWDKIKNHKKEVVEKIKISLEKLFLMKKIEIIKGSAYFNGLDSAIIKNEQTETKITFDFAVLAAGTKPFYPPPFETHKDRLTDSDKVFDLEKLPGKMTIVGAGVIGLELACFFNAMGCDIEIIELFEEILPSEDQQAVRVLKTALEKRGVKFHLKVKTKNLFFENGKKTVELDTGLKIEADEILVSAGRTADLANLNLKAAQIEHGKWVKTGLDLKTTNPKIYSVGDINGISLLAHSAERQGEIAAENIMGKNEKFEPEIVPYCIYTWPEIASVGMKKKQADELGIKTKTKKSYFQVLGRAISSNQTEGFCQLLLDENDILIGATIAGGPATELIHLLALAIKKKMTTKEINSMIFAHPTMSEIIKEALLK